jgi:hypothetical protein
MFRQLLGVPALLSLIVLNASGPAALAESEMAKKLGATAEAAWNKAQQACGDDVRKYCDKVTPGEGRTALCMLAHEDKISEKCVNMLFDLAENFRLTVSNVIRAAEVCDEEIGKVCGKVEPGEGRIAQCLRENQAKLSSPCNAELAGLQARLKK